MTRTVADHVAPMWLRVLRGAAIGGAMLFGFGMVILATTVGRCDSFGGACPADRPSLFEDDVFGIAAFGAALLVAVPIFLARPSIRRLLIAVVAGIAAGLLVGLAARSSAHG